MRNASRTLLTREGNREFPAAVPYRSSRATPIAPRPVRPSEFPAEERPTRIDVAYDHRDQESWPAAPRFSEVRPFSRSFSLPPKRARRARFGHGTAKLLLASVLSSIAALVRFALRSRTGHGL